jgi:hypothetical protein
MVIYFSTSANGERDCYCQVGKQVEKGGLGELIDKALSDGFVLSEMGHAQIPVSLFAYGHNVAKIDGAVMLCHKEVSGDIRAILTDFQEVDGASAPYSKVGYCAFACLEASGDYSYLASSDKEVSEAAQHTYENMVA